MTIAPKDQQPSVNSSDLPYETSEVLDEIPYSAEPPKRNNKRMLITGMLLVFALILLMVIGSHVIKNFKVTAAEKKAMREREELAKQTQARPGREFITEPAVTQEAPPQTPVAIEAPKAPPNPLPVGAGGPLPPGQPPLPAAYPMPSGVPPQAQPPQPQPSMMLSAGTELTQASAASKAASMISDSTPRSDEAMTVQAMAHGPSSGRQPTSTRQSVASRLGDRSFVIARGSWIPCVLETQLNTSVPGDTSCVITEDVYSDDGKVLLIEKGSRGQGSFGNTLKVGDERIAVNWNRIKTSKGVVIDVDSPAADGIGTSGAGGAVDNHWMQRIGAAVLLSFIEDGVSYAVAQKQASNSQSGTNVYVPSNSVQSTTRLSEKILDSTINIPPTLYKNRGDRIMIFVNRDLWFDKTYKLVKSE